MLIRIGAVGRMKAGPERELVTRYLNRATATGRPLGLTGFNVAECPESRASDVTRRRLEEARALSASLPEGGTSVFLDATGRGVSSEALAALVDEWRTSGRPATSFIIGGADGLDRSLIAEADLVLALSPLTWPHQLVRIMLAEQLYRVTTIIAGHPYHRGG